MVLITGVGRSGTHLLAQLLASHPQLTVDFEAQPQFNYAVNAVVWGRDFFNLLNLYRTKNSPYYVAKDHTTLWLYDQLTALIPDIKFITIERNPYQVIASSLRHKGVMSWITDADKYPPNPLSGTLSPLYKTGMSHVELLTLRWLEHSIEIDRITKNKNVMGIAYDDLLDIDIRAELANFIGIDNQFVMPQIKETRTKWHNILTNKQIEQIDNLLTA